MKKSIENPPHGKLSSILECLIKKKGITPIQLSGYTQIPIGTMYRLLNNDKANPTLSSLRPLAKFFNISINQLAGDDPLDIHNLPKSYEEDDANWQKVPIFSWDNIIAQIQHVHTPEKTQCIKIDADLSKKAFALIMSNDTASLLFPPGTTLIFDPEKPPYHGAYVIAYLSKLKRYVLKQLILDDPFTYLRSIVNVLEQSPPIQIQEGDQIIATLIQSKTNFSPA